MRWSSSWRQRRHRRAGAAPVRTNATNRDEGTHEKQQTRGGRLVLLRPSRLVRLPRNDERVVRLRFGVDGEVVQVRVTVPGVALHGERVHVGEVGRETRRARDGGHGGALDLVQVLDEELILLAQVARLERVTADHVLLLEMKTLDVVLVLLLGGLPLVLLAHVLGLSNLQLGQLVLQLGDDVRVVLLFLLEPLGVLLLALPRIEAASREHGAETGRDDGLTRLVCS